MNTNVTVYTMPFCPNCDELKEYLRNLKVPIAIKDLEDPDVNVDLLYQGIVPTEAPLLKVKDNCYESGSLFSRGKLNTDFINSVMGAGSFECCKY